MRTARQIFIFSVFFLPQMKGQNLVPNPSFESFLCCPSPTVTVATDNLACASPWFRADPTCSPDYFNPCDGTGIFSSPSNAFGYQNAHTGVSYAGFYTFNKSSPNSSRDYIEIQLTNPLLSNEMYLVSFFVNLANNPQYSTNTIGAYFSSLQITGSSCNRLSFSAQIQNTSINPLTDTSSWILITDTLYPIGGEKYMTMGNFMLDDLSDTLFLYNSTGWNSSYYYIDDVSVTDLGPTDIKKFRANQVKVYPNPVNEVLNIENTLKDAQLIITDILGNIVFQNKLNGSEPVNVENLSKGIYFIQLRTNGKNFTNKFVKD